MATEDEHAPAAGAPVDGHSANPWARHGREDLQGSHSLTAPLARWAPELVEPPPLDAPPGESEPATRRQPVMVIEAMKMQNNVGPEVDGVVKAVHVSPGDAVKAGQVLFELE